MKKALWIRLKQYRFENLAPRSFTDRIVEMFGGDDAFTRAFAAKVAKKHGWSPEVAFLAVREYKKFVFLGVTSTYEVTPSTIIDKVWHEHQLFTRGYREFCQTVLHRHFDHDPELIPFDEQTGVFSAQYEETLKLYEQEFGMKPPYEIWGRPKFRPDAVPEVKAEPKKKKRDSSDDSSDDTPLYNLFSSPADAHYAPIPVEFSGKGGSFGGAGAEGSWEAPASPSHDTADAPSADSPSADSSPGCSTSSGCSSSSCGGGGGD